MLQVDLNRLRREGRLLLEESVPPDSEFWTETDLDPRSPLEVRLEAQQAGPDVIVRGRVSGTFVMECRRCLDPVEVETDEELARVYREGDERVEEESEDVLVLPAGPELDLTGPVRETVLLAAPRYVYCREECQGLCPQCGTNLNLSTCGCAADDADERWAPLRRLKAEE